MYASHFNWLQVSFRRTSLSSTGFESRKGERFPRAQGRRYLPVSASILLYFESLILNPTLWTHCGSPARTSSQSDQQSHAAVTSGNQSIPDAQLTNELFSDLKVSTATARDVAARLICKKSLCCAQTRFDPKSFAKGRDRWRSLGNKARALKQIASNSRLVDEALLGYASQRKCLPVFTSTTEETSPACAEALVRVHSAPACHHG